MGQYDLNEALAKHMVKKGDPARNPTGIQGSKFKRQRSFEIKAALATELSEPCEVAGFEHLSKFHYGIRNIVGRFMEGDKWAAKFVIDRLFGRVPFEITAAPANPLESLAEDELLERLDLLRTAILTTPSDTSTDKYANAICVDDLDKVAIEGDDEPVP